MYIGLGENYQAQAADRLAKAKTKIDLNLFRLGLINIRRQ